MDTRKVGAAQDKYCYGETARFRNRLLSLDPAVRAAAHAELAAMEENRKQRQLDHLASLEKQIRQAKGGYVRLTGTTEKRPRSSKRLVEQYAELERYARQQQRKGRAIARRKARAKEKASNEQK